MNDKLLDYLIKIQAISQNGLEYGKDKYDLERYSALRELCAKMMSEKTGLDLELVKDVFCNEKGYQTPKIDTRAAVFLDDKILLVHENNGTWSLPGGWCDVDQSIKENTLKEIKEETGLNCEFVKLIALQDWRKHNVTNFAYGIIKSFAICKIIDGDFITNIETTEIKYFSESELPNNMANEKCTKEQVLMCFKYHKNIELDCECD